MGSAAAEFRHTIVTDRASIPSKKRGGGIVARTSGRDSGQRRACVTLVAEVGATPITANYGTDATTLKFHINPVG